MRGRDLPCEDQFWMDYDVDWRGIREAICMREEVWNVSRSWLLVRGVVGGDGVGAQANRLTTFIHSMTLDMARFWLPNCSKTQNRSPNMLMHENSFWPCQDPQISGSRWKHWLYNQGAPALAKMVKRRASFSPPCYRDPQFKAHWATFWNSFSVIHFSVVAKLQSTKRTLHYI